MMILEINDVDDTMYIVSYACNLSRKKCTTEETNVVSIFGND